MSRPIKEMSFEEMMQNSQAFASSSVFGKKNAVLSSSRVLYSNNENSANLSSAGLNPDLYTTAKKNTKCNKSNESLYMTHKEVCSSEFSKKGVDLCEELVLEVEEEMGENDQDEDEKGGEDGVSSDLQVEEEDLDLPEAITSRLYDHQREGISWLYRLHLSRLYRGGILGDDMGLGKTFQVVCLLTGLLRQNKIHTAILLVVPVAVVHSWYRELEQHLIPHVSRRVQVHLASGEVSIPKRKKILSTVFERAAKRNPAPSVVISTYTVVANLADAFVDCGNSSHTGSENDVWKWDYVILDEGHQIKNPGTAMSKAVHRLPSRKRLVLTGTPIQNNLLEFWTLMNWATKGHLFGTRSMFSKKFMEPIVRGQDPHASEHVRSLALRAADELAKTISPVMLQRKKENVLIRNGSKLLDDGLDIYQLQKVNESDKNSQKGACGDTPADGGETDDGKETCTPSDSITVSDKTSGLDLPPKTELAVWIPMAPSQRLQYQMYLQSCAASVALRKDKEHYPVEHINHLKTLCRHPFLLDAGRALKCSSSKDNEDSATISESSTDALCDDLDSMMTRLTVSATRTNSDTDKKESKKSYSQNVFELVGREPPIHELLEQSVKLQSLLELCVLLRKERHRILVFTQSRMMADIIERVLDSRGLTCVRIDGRVTGRERQRIIDAFNAPVTEEEQLQDQFYPVNRESPRSGPRRAHIALLTTKACGTGITLTGADRVILHDPSWNPAEDRQAVDRAYRIGQGKPVVVFRMIMASTVEEKMYEKQVFKDGVRVVLEQGKHSQSQSRYFSAEQTKELFTLGPADSSIVMQKLWMCAGEKIQTLPGIGDQLPGVLGYSRHDRLYDEAQYNQYSADAVCSTKTRSADKVPDIEEFADCPPRKSANKMNSAINDTLPSRRQKTAEQSPVRFINTYTREELLKQQEKEQEQEREEIQKILQESKVKDPRIQRRREFLEKKSAQESMRIHDLTHSTQITLSSKSSDFQKVADQNESEWSETSNDSALNDRSSSPGCLHHGNAKIDISDKQTNENESISLNHVHIDLTVTSPTPVRPSPIYSRVDNHRLSDHDESSPDGSEAEEGEESDRGDSEPEDGIDIMNSDHSLEYRDNEEYLSESSVMVKDDETVREIIWEESGSGTDSNTSSGINTSSDSNTVLTPIRDEQLDSSAHAGLCEDSPLSPSPPSVGRGQRRIILSDSEESSSECEDCTFLSNRRISSTPMEKQPQYSSDGFNNDIGGYDNFIPEDDCEFAQKAAPPVLEHIMTEDEREELLLLQAMIEADDFICETEKQQDEENQRKKTDTNEKSQPRFYDAQLSKLVSNAGYTELEPPLSDLAPRPMVCVKPAHEVRESDLQRNYNEMISQAEFTRIHAHGLSCVELEAALLCSALDICDADPAVHGRLAALQAKLEATNESNWDVDGKIGMQW